jgi:hypothetical protein
MDLVELKSHWNQVLDELEQSNRIAWLAYFDGRLAKLEDGSLTLDFSDPAKLAGGHDFTHVRKSEHRRALELAIKKITGLNLQVIDG